MRGPARTPRAAFRIALWPCSLWADLPVASTRRVFIFVRRRSPSVTILALGPIRTSALAFATVCYPCKRRRWRGEALEGSMVFHPRLLYELMRSWLATTGGLTARPPILSSIQERDSAPVHPR
jgi:hypothetical protein